LFNQIIETNIGKITMKNKLITSALVTSMIGFGTAAVGQTTVSGNLEVTYNAVKDKAANINSFRGFGKESQINMANKGKLNNGMDYAAGFSLEFDGPDVNFGTGAAVSSSTGSNVHSENVYIDIISGDTTLTFGADHIQSPDTNLTMLAGFGYIALDGISGVTGLYPKSANSPYSAYGVGLMQKTPVGTFSAYYAPTNNTNSGAGNDVHNSATAAQFEPASIIAAGEESAYEFGFRGDLGVKGLTFLAFMNKSDHADSETGTGAKDVKGHRVATSYVTGPWSIAADYVKVEGVAVAASASATNRDSTVKGKSLGIGYALTPTLTASITRGKADTDDAKDGVEGAGAGGTADETTDVFALGYNLGPLTSTVQFKQVDNSNGVAGRDGKSIQARIGARF
jgi:hypothetical protein